MLSTGILNHNSRWRNTERLLPKLDSHKTTAGTIVERIEENPEITGCERHISVNSLD